MYKLLLLSLLFTLSSFAKDTNLLKNGDFSSKYSWKYEKASYMKDKKNQYLRMKAYGDYYDNYLSQKVRIAAGTYSYSFKVRGHNKARFVIQAAPRIDYWNDLKVSGSHNSVTVGADWQTVTGKIDVPGKKHNYFTLWLYTPSGYYKNKDFYLEIDDFVLTKK